MAPTRFVLEGSTLRFLVTLEGVLRNANGAPPDNLEQRLDRLMERLAHLSDPAIGARAADGMIEVTITVEADALEDASSKGAAAIREAAVTAAGDDIAFDWESVKAHRSERVQA